MKVYTTKVQSLKCNISILIRVNTKVKIGVFWFGVWFSVPVQGRRLELCLQNIHS